MRPYKMLIFIILVIAALAYYKLYYLDSSNTPKQAGKAAQSVLSVNAIVAKSGKTNNKLYLSGTAYAGEEVQLVPELSGKLILLDIPEGKLVQRGTLLAKINDIELQAQLKKVHSELELQKSKEARNKKLLDINSISREEYENSLNEYQLSKAEEELIRAQIQKTEIRAPFSGILGFKNIGPGAYVSPTQIITSIQQIDPIKIEFSVPEKYRLLLKPGIMIKFGVDGLKEQFHAKIDIIESKIDINTRTIKVRAVYPNPGRKILPGAFVKIELALKDIENSILIPSHALIPILKGYKVFVAENGLAQERIVETGLRTDTEVQILSGLHDGDTIITSGIMSLKNGIAVNLSKMND